MLNETYISGGNTYKITVYPAPSDGKKYPVVFLLHGNFGLIPPYGDQIQDFAANLASLGYMTVVPQYYQDDLPHVEDIDTTLKVQILTDAISTVSSRLGSDPARIGLIGYSLGAAIAMTFIAANLSVKINVIADFFGFITPTIRAGISNFPPTIIFHNKKDQIVSVQHSEELDKLLPSTIEHKLFIYDENWQQVNHVFKPKGTADVNSRKNTVDWLKKHLPPTGF
jgi:dienelactone hydrolase